MVRAQDTAGLHPRIIPDTHRSHSCCTPPLAAQQRRGRQREVATAGSAPGARVRFEGFAGEPEQNPKKLAKKKVTRGDAAREMPRVAWTRMREARARPWRRRRSHLAL